MARKQTRAYRSSCFKAYSRRKRKVRYSRKRKIKETFEIHSSSNFFSPHLLAFVLSIRPHPHFSTLFGTSYPRESITDEEATVDSGIGGEKGRREEPKSTEGRRVE